MSTQEQEDDFKPDYVAITDAGKEDSAATAAAEPTDEGKPEGEKPTDESAPKGEGDGEDTAGKEDTDEDGEKQPGKDADSADGKESDLEKSEKDKEQQRGQKRNKSISSRMRKMASQRNEALRAQEEAERKAAELEAENQRLKGDTGADRPNRYDFNTDEEYDQALNRWIDEQVTARQQQSGSEDRQGGNQKPTADQQIRAESVASMIETGEELFDDFREVVTAMPREHVTEGMIDVLSDLDPEPAARMTHHLATHPDEAQHLAQLQGHALAVEMGRVSAAVESANAKPSSDANQAPSSDANQAPSSDANQAPSSGGSRPPDKTQAPAPIEPVQGGDAQVTDEENLPIDDWMERQWEKDGLIPTRK